MKRFKKAPVIDLRREALPFVSMSRRDGTREHLRTFCIPDFRRITGFKAPKFEELVAIRVHVTRFRKRKFSKEKAVLVGKANNGYYELGTLRQKWRGPEGFDMPLRMVPAAAWEYATGIKMTIKEGPVKVRLGIEKVNV